MFNQNKSAQQFTSQGVFLPQQQGFLPQQQQGFLPQQQQGFLPQQQQGFLPQQQQGFLPQQQAPLMNAPIGKKSRGHHHGLRNKRAQAVLPAQQFAGQSAIANLPAQNRGLVAAPINNLPINNQMQQLSLAQNQGQQTIYRDAVVQEVYRTDNIIHVQPIINRVVEQDVIHIIEQHITEAAPLPQQQIVQLPPIINETKVVRHINEIQPIVHRETANVVTERVVENFTERVVAPTQHREEVIHEAAPFAPVAAPIAAPILSAPMAPLPLQQTEITRMNPIAPAPIISAPMAPLAPHQTEITRVSPIAPTPIISAPMAPLAPQTHSITKVVPNMAAAPALAAAPLAAPLATRALNDNIAHEEVLLAPVVQETIRTDRVLEIQPIVHREVDSTVINHVELHKTEAPAPLMSGVVRNAPIVQESVQTHVIDEIQPIVHREIAQVQVENVREDIYERTTAPVVHTNTEVIEAAPVMGLAQQPLAQQYPTLMPTEQKPGMLSSLKSKLNRNKGQAAM